MVTSWDGRGARRGGSTCDHGLVGKDALQPGDDGKGKCGRVMHGKGIDGGLDAAGIVNSHREAAQRVTLHFGTGVLGYRRRKDFMWMCEGDCFGAAPPRQNVVGPWACSENSDSPPQQVSVTVRNR